jgi:1,6-anhydro-N-acetylmuramate kinase
MPRYVQRKRGARVLATGVTVTNHEAWGWAGDFVWAFAFIWLGWAAMTIFWRAAW